jgi:hypothetical protein
MFKRKRIAMVGLVKSGLKDGWCWTAMGNLDENS